MNESKPIAAYRECLSIERQAALGILPERLTIAEIAALNPADDDLAKLLLEAWSVYLHRECESSRDKDPELYSSPSPEQGPWLRGELISGPEMLRIMMESGESWAIDPPDGDVRKLDVRNGLLISVHRDDLKAFLQWVGYPIPADALLNAWCSPATARPDTEPQQDLHARLNPAQTRLREIVDALEQYAADMGRPFDRKAMPGPLGENWKDDEGSFHWLCAKLDPAFARAPDTFKKHKHGICAVVRGAKPTDFYREALPRIAPKFRPCNPATHTKKRK